MKREPLHTRTVTFNTYRRSDSLFDVEAEMLDRRHYDTTVAEKGDLAAGAPVHHMFITATINEEMEVRAITSQLKVTPFRYCTLVEDSLQAMVGARMATGWRRAINERVHASESCTHLRELLQNMATAALQTVPTWKSQQRLHAGEDRTQNNNPPHYLGQCHSWQVDGQVVKMYLPQFYRAISSSLPESDTNRST